MRTILKYVGGFVLTALLLAWVFRGVGLQAVGDSMARASWGLLLVSGVLQCGHNVFRVFRWRALLSPVRRDVPFAPMWSAVMIGYLTSWTIPGRLGELVRPALLTTREDIPLGPCIGSVLADRIMDAVAIVVLFAIGIGVTPLGGEAAEHARAVRTGATVLVAAATVPLSLLLAASALRSRLERWLADRHGVIAWCVRSLLSVALGTEALRRPRRLPGILGNSLAAWLTISAGTWLGIRAVGVHIPFTATFVLMPLLALGVALPTPGGAGGYHAAAKVGLVYLFGVPEVQAVSAGIVSHLASVVPVLIMGAIALWRERVSWSDLMRTARQVRDIGRVGPVVGAAPPRAEEVTS